MDSIFTSAAAVLKQFGCECCALEQVINIEEEDVETAVAKLVSEHITHRSRKRTSHSWVAAEAIGNHALAGLSDHAIDNLKDATVESLVKRVSNPKKKVEM